MSLLSSLLVRDQVVPVRKIEEAIQRQVISGGDLETVLLEMEAVPENVLSAYRAALFGLVPATRDEIMRVPRETIRLVPREVAEQQKLVPLAAEDRTLVVAVSTPLDPETDHQLAFLLGRDLVMRIVTEVRLLAALSHHYEIEPPARIQRLVEKLRERPAGGVPFVEPPNTSDVPTPARGSSRPPRPGDLPTARPVADDPQTTFDSVPTDKIQPSPEVTQPPPEAPRVDRAAYSAVTKPIPPRPAEDTSAFDPTPEVGLSRVAALAREARARTPAPEDSIPTRPPTKSGGEPIRRVHGPLSPKEAVQLLAEAQDRNAILETLFAFARQFFEYTAVFVVQEDVVEGRDASGPGATGEEVQRITVPLNVPSAFVDVRRMRGPVVRDMRKTEADLAAIRGLRRETSQPAVLLPIAIRQRVVMVVYGDRNGEAFEVRDVPQLLAFLPRVSEAFERIILQRKVRGSVPAPSGEGAPRRKSVMGLPAASERASSEEEQAPAAESASSATDANAESASAEINTRHSARPAGRNGASTILGVPRTPPPPPVIQAAHDEPSLNATRPQEDQEDPDEPEVIVDYAAQEAESETITEEAAPSSAETTPAESEEAKRASWDSDTPPTPSGLEGGEAPWSRFVTSNSSPPNGASPSTPPSSGATSGGRRRSVRPDPRREDDRSSSIHDVVRLPGAPATPTAVERSSTPSESAPKGREEPKVIVNMGDEVSSLVNELVRARPDSENPAMRSLVALGDVALPVLAQRFPGPLWFDRNRPHRRLPRGRDVSAIARALVAFRERAVPYIASLLGSKDNDVRFYATLLASEVLHPDLIASLGICVFEGDSGTQALAMDVLRLYAQYTTEFTDLLRELRVAARVAGPDLQKRRTAARALGELRDSGSLDLLVALLKEDDPQLVQAACRGLVVLTRQDFGDSHRKWAAWASKNGTRHRIEWLIDGLLHPDEDVRTAAGEELKRITQEYFGYHAGLPKREREIAQKRYRTWWEQEGRRKFG